MCKELPQLNTPSQLTSKGCVVGYLITYKPLQWMTNARQLYIATFITAMVSAQYI
jgi:hypothetical protein